MIKKALFVAGFSLATTAQSFAYEIADRVVAVVNDAVITQVDLSNRLALVQKSMKAPLTGKNFFIFQQQILNTLLEEELVRQHAKEKEIEIPEEEFTGMIAFIEQKNGIKKGEFETAFGEQTTTAVSQIKNDILRQKIVNRFVRPRISIAPEEIDEMLENIASAQDKLLERRLQHIFVEINEDKPHDAAKAIKRAYRSIASGQDFGAVAKTFSTNAFAKDGGDLGWSTPGELSNELEGALSGLSKGDVTEPVEVAGGWHILKISDARRPNLPAFKQIQEADVYQVRLVKTAENKDKQTTFKEEADDLNSKADFQKFIRLYSKDADYKSSGYLGYMSVSALPKRIASVVTKTPKNETTPVIETEKALTKIYVANKRKRTPKAVEQYRKKLEERMLSNRMERLSQRFFRNLRRKAYIDVRL